LPLEGKGAEVIMNRFTDEFQQEKRSLSSGPKLQTMFKQQSTTGLTSPLSHKKPAEVAPKDAVPAPTPPSVPIIEIPAERPGPPRRKTSNPLLSTSNQVMNLFKPRTRSPSPSVPSNFAKDSKLIRDLAAFLNSSTFFFSYDDDLTLSLQRRREMKETAGLPLWMKADDRFFWNADTSEVLIQLQAHRFILPIMQGFVQLMVNCSMEDAGFVFALISRRSKERAGMVMMSKMENILV
jgi:hypothetical protein